MGWAISPTDGGQHQTAWGAGAAKCGPLPGNASPDDEEVYRRHGAHYLGPPAEQGGAFVNGLWIPHRSLGVACGGTQPLVKVGQPPFVSALEHPTPYRHTAKGISVLSPKVNGYEGLCYPIFKKAFNLWQTPQNPKRHRRPL